MSRVLLALGSNLGDRLDNLRTAMALLGAANIEITRRSGVWETAPVPADQPPFLNAAVEAETTLAPHDLLRELKAIEKRLGRKRGPRWGPRPIDIDILFYDSLQLESAALTIPHPRIAERVFVLAPLAEVEDGELPILCETATTLLSRLPQEGASRTTHSL